MNYTRPEGCRAAVTSSWERVPGSWGSDEFKLTAQMVCGERTNVARGSFGRGFLNLGDAYNEEQTTARVGAQVTEILGAMCLGCPYNANKQTEAAKS